MIISDLGCILMIFKKCQKKKISGHFLVMIVLIHLEENASHPSPSPRGSAPSLSKGAQVCKVEEPPLGSLAAPADLGESASHQIILSADSSRCV